MTRTPVEMAPPTHRRVLRIALPIVLSNATVPILGLVDTGVVGQMGAAAPIGAVGIGAVILTSIYWVFGFLRMGTAGLTAQALGADDREEVVAILSRALLVAALGGIGLIALQGPMMAGAFALSPASAEVEDMARGYIGIRVWSAPAAIALYGVTGWLIAQERTRAVLLLQLWMNGLNMGLDVLFVLSFGWGVNGVAVATFIAEWSGLALGLWICRGALLAPAARAWTAVFDRARMLRMATLNRDILIRSLLLEAIFVSFLFFAADLGDATLAANQVLLQFLHITAYALDGFAFSAEALVGQAMGARQRQVLRRSAVLTSFWGGIAGLLLTVGFAVAGGTIVDLMTTAEDVRVQAREFLPWMMVVPVFGAAAWMLDGIFVGATRSKDMRNMMVVSVLAYGAALAVLMPAFGNHGLWAALMVSFVVRGVTLGLRYPALEAEAA
ncbi:MULTISPECIES: MATE family efflux transporter [unclassified Meridianimarinicoccus]|uniref:MATE family efflux transporter n=1 Tax=unclassified Meridianimarinicoccus TaxID=2923344 RepID=UPI001D02ED5B|nr:MATE family efflux transporter [Fluviibacterium sp. MJW13]